MASTFVVAFAAAILAGSTALAGEFPLAIQVVVDQEEFVPGETIAAWLVYRNTTNSPLRIAMNLERLPLSLIFPDGMRRPSGSEVADYALMAPTCTTLPAHGAWVELVSLDGGLKGNQFGRYLVTASLPTRRCTTIGLEHSQASLSAPNSVPATSTPVAFELVDRADPGTRMIQECSASGRSWSTCFSDRRAALAELVQPTILRPYLELTALALQPRRSAKAAELVQWSRDFRERYPTFRQLALLYSTLLEASELSNDSSGRAEIRAEASKVLGQHVAVSYFAQKREPGAS